MVHKIPRKGTTALQFAVVAPAFFALIFGLIEISRGFMAVHLVTNAARQGCRQGILANTSTQSITTVVNNLLTSQGIQGSTTTVQVNGASADASTANSNDQITVIVSAPVSSVTWVPGASFLKGSITGQFSLRRE